MGNSVVSGEATSMLSSVCTSGTCIESTNTNTNTKNMLTMAPSKEELHEYFKQEEDMASKNTGNEDSNNNPNNHSSLRSKRGGLFSSANKKKEQEDDHITASSGTSPAKNNSSRRSSRRKGVRHKSHRLFAKLGHALFSHNNNNNTHAKSAAITPPKPNVRGGVRLRGCETDEEHKQRTRHVVEQLRHLHGEEGLKAIGLEYRRVPIVNIDDLCNTENGIKVKEDHPAAKTQSASKTEDDDDPTKYVTKLFHSDSQLMITQQNRKEFIADGDMYDSVARVCQEFVQDMMQSEGKLKWITVCDAGNNPEPIRAMVSADVADKAENNDNHALDQRPTLLIATGKGKVRAGIFSRQHLLLSGIECSTALPVVREAKRRGLNMVLLDPNVNGDRLGMETFQKTMAMIFHRWEQTTPVDQTQETAPALARDLFVLSHSQSGAQFARYLLEKSSHYLPYIRAIAFTDSTHNIQWAKAKPELRALLQSDKSVYFRCSKAASASCPLGTLETAGEKVDTDSFWQHRFGLIDTRCAGTTEHSLTNWFARHHIWDHFDRFLVPTAAQ